MRARIITSARELIAIGGLAGLRARDIAEKAGCALGGLYTIFSDLDDIILNVNSLTLADMESALRNAERDAETPKGQLRALALAYLKFALENRTLWAALFEHRMPEGIPVPEWHLAEHAFLIRLIAEPLSKLQPELGEIDLAIRARSLFGAIHGVIMISMEGRFVGLPVERLALEIATLTDALASGLSGKT
jgi:AcrR family transcriptional regulator